MNDSPLGASFRDPSGFVFRHQGRVYRQVNQCYAGHYEQLMGSGLYTKLVEKGLLVPHEEVQPPVAASPEHLRTLLPEQLPFISHPYEWSFSQLKDAAIVTLRLQRLALHAGMTLKDATAYNIQFLRGRPVLIDSLSFETLDEGAPWIAYRQFCQHFVAPLALMAYRDVRLGSLLRVHLDGVPLDLAATLLPTRAWLRLGLLMHIRAHARFQRRFEGTGDPAARARAATRPKRQLSRQAQIGLVDSLARAVGRLRWEPSGTEWAEYDALGSYDDAALAHKKSLVRSYLDRIAPQQVWDLGANTGIFSRIAADTGAEVVSFDVDPACVERSYLQARSEKDQRVLPLLLDLVNPSPSLGWAHEERESLLDRAGPDVVLALALIHHLAISNNVPLDRIARYLARLAPQLVIEFVPKSDAKVQVLLATREDIFPSYTREGFEHAFEQQYETLASEAIPGSERVLYLLRRRARPGGDREHNHAEENT